MNILHIGILSHYTEGMMYQDNILSEMNLKDGHTVTFITDTSYYLNGKLTKTKETDMILSNGLRLIRIEYDWIINQFVTDKIQKISRLTKLIEEINPNIIMYHGACGYELMNVSLYIKKHPEVSFYIDSHEDFNNTAKTVLARLCYKYIHGFFLKCALPYVKKVLYISYETKDYLKQMYKLSDEIMEFYPLGGIIVSEEQQISMRDRIINKYNFPKDAIICAHSGKLVEQKKTKELIESFSKVKDIRLRLLIFGSIPETQKKILEPLIKNDDRILFIGWKHNDEIVDLLAGSDLYCQPGTQSATFQIALCAGCATMIYPDSSHEFLIGDNCWYVENINDMVSVLKNISKDTNTLYKIKKLSYEKSKQILDYTTLARRICE